MVVSWYNAYCNFSKFQFNIFLNHLTGSRVRFPQQNKRFLAKHILTDILLLKTEANPIIKINAF